MSTTKAPRAKRSRNGCLSCKKLRIKCNEDKPSCDYCVHTGRTCIYPNDVPREILDTQALSINSGAAQLQINQFQYRLFKYFVNFGAEFFSQNLNQKLINVWAQDVPKLFVKSDLARKAIYAITSIGLWQDYRLSEIPNVVFYDEGVPMNLFLETGNIFSQLLEALAENKLNGDLENDVSQVVASIVMFTYLGVHPAPPIKFVDLSGTSNPLDILSLCKSHREMAFKVRPTLENTPYQVLVSPQDWIINDDTQFTISQDKFPILEHLREFIADNEYLYDVINLGDYSLIINRIENALSRCIENSNYLPFYRLLTMLSYNVEWFDDLLRSKDYIAMKVMFYFCVFCQLCEFQINPDASVWDQYMDEYIMTWPAMDMFDNWLYQTTRVNKYRIDKSQVGLLAVFAQDELNQTRSSPMAQDPVFQTF